MQLKESDVWAFLVRSCALGRGLPTLAHGTSVLVGVTGRVLTPREGREGATVLGVG